MSHENDPDDLEPFTLYLIRYIRARTGQPVIVDMRPGWHSGGRGNILEYRDPVPVELKLKRIVVRPYEEVFEGVMASPEKYRGKKVAVRRVPFVRSQYKVDAGVGFLNSGF